MKTCLIAFLVIATAATTIAAAETYTAPARPRTAPRERPTPLRPGEVDGVIPRGIRG